jgi:hypothetical protein
MEANYFFIKMEITLKILLTDNRLSSCNGLMIEASLLFNDSKNYLESTSQSQFMIQNKLLHKRKYQTPNTPLNG